MNTNMTRAYGRGLEGERVIGRVPFAAWKEIARSSQHCDAMA